VGTAVSAKVKTILLVDDDPGARESIKLLLSIDRHTVTEAANGHEALQLFTGSRYDLVITDYFMPEMLGDELAQNIKNIAPEQPILMVTGYLEKLVDAGKSVDAVLGKPLSVDQLRRAMATRIQRTTSPEKAANGLVELSRSDLANRTSATTKVLEEIVRRKRLARPPRHWGINE
jgi:CheY-like chemotaxis protein